MTQARAGWLVRLMLSVAVAAFLAACGDGGGDVGEPGADALADIDR